MYINNYGDIKSEFTCHIMINLTEFRVFLYVFTEIEKTTQQSISFVITRTMARSVVSLIHIEVDS